MRLRAFGASMLAMLWLSACVSAPTTGMREPDEAGDHDLLLSQTNAAHVVVREVFVSADVQRLVEVTEGRVDERRCDREATLKGRKDRCWE